MLSVRVFKVYELQGGVSSFPFNLVGVDFNFKLLSPTPEENWIFYFIALLRPPWHLCCLYVLFKTWLNIPVLLCGMACHVDLLI